MVRLSAKQEELYQTLMQRRSSFVRPLVAVGVVLTVLGCGAAGVATQMHFYQLSAGTRAERVTLFPGTAEQAAAQAGFDGFTITDTREDGATTYVTLTAQRQASVRMGNSLYMLPFTACTVQELLDSAGIKTGKDDIITPEPDTYMMKDTEITIVQVTHRAEQKTEKIPYTVQTRDSAELEKGQSRVVQAGKDGDKLLTLEVELHDGEEFKRTVKSERVISEPVVRIVENGTKKPAQTAKQQSVSKTAASAATQSTDIQALQAMQNAAAANSNTLNSGSYGALSTAGRSNVWSEPCIATTGTNTLTVGGETYTFSAVVDVMATAYHRIEEGGLITATGTTTQYGTIAVDPRVIPLGSRLYVVADDGSSWSYGPGLAEDTGGLIKGNRIDLFFMTGEEADTFGVRNAKVYILS